MMLVEEAEGQEEEEEGGVGAMTSAAVAGNTSFPSCQAQPV